MVLRTRWLCCSAQWVWSSGRSFFWPKIVVGKKRQKWDQRSHRGTWPGSKQRQQVKHSECRIKKTNSWWLRNTARLKCPPLRCLNPSPAPRLCRQAPPRRTPSTGWKMKMWNYDNTAGGNVHMNSSRPLWGAPSLWRFRRRSCLHIDRFLEGAVIHVSGEEISKAKSATVVVWNKDSKKTTSTSWPAQSRTTFGRSPQGKRFRWYHRCSLKAPFENPLPQAGATGMEKCCCAVLPWKSRESCARPRIMSKWSCLAL